MNDKPLIQGTEEGWRSASTDSRRHEKHREIKGFVDKYAAQQAKVKQDHEDRFMDDLVELAGPVVYAGLEKAGHSVGGGRNRAYATNYDKWIASLGE